MFAVKKKKIVTSDQWFLTEQTHLQRLGQSLTLRGQVYLMERGQTYRKDLVLWPCLSHIYYQFSQFFLVNRVMALACVVLKTWQSENLMLLLSHRYMWWIRCGKSRFVVYCGSFHLHHSIHEGSDNKGSKSLSAMLHKCCVYKDGYLNKLYISLTVMCITGSCKKTLSLHHWMFSFPVFHTNMCVNERQSHKQYKTIWFLQCCCSPRVCIKLD